MKNKSHTFSYYFVWVLVGLITGVAILMQQGHIQPTIFGQNLNGGTESRPQTAGFAQAVTQASPSVVSIQTARHVKAPPTKVGKLLQERFLGKNSPHAPKYKTSITAGSGVILDARGYILTNYHVIKNAEAIHVTLNDGRNAKANLIGNDPDTDLAVLKIEMTNLPQAKPANLANIQIGDIALAIGYPFNIGQTVTQGIISATGRTQLRSNTYANFIQTDAAINPGNSGGALINTKGEIVGINSLIFTKTGDFSGIGFAIPIDLAKTVLEQIITNGYVVRGWLGVGGTNLTPQILNKIGLRDIRGVLLTDVDEGGPGDNAGLKPGDIITHINGQPLMSVKDVLDIIAAGKPDDIFDIEGLRQRQSFTTKTILGQRPVMSRE
jgi:serine protease DegS